MTKFTVITNDDQRRALTDRLRAAEIDYLNQTWQLGQAEAVKNENNEDVIKTLKENISSSEKQLKYLRDRLEELGGPIDLPQPGMVPGQRPPGM